jgi:hypothetical protein
MELDDLIDQVQAQLTAAAALGDERTREIAASLATAAAPAVRIAIISALSSAADEATAALIDYPGSPTLAIGLDGEHVRVDVRASVPVDQQAPRADENDTSARISLRLPESLKADIEDAAGREAISVNSWLIRAANGALQPSWGGFNAAHFAGWADAAARRGQSPHHITGWING